MHNIREISILLVDDDPVFRATLRTMLGQVQNSWTCYEASTVNEAQAVMAIHVLDLAIVDVHLPDGTAVDVIRQAGQTPCLLCTQDDQRPSFLAVLENQSVAENIVGYIAKPLQPGVITSIRAGLQIGQERKMRNRLVAEATADLEEERRDIAQNLHDAMGASLTRLNWVFIGIARLLQKKPLDEIADLEMATLCRQGQEIVSNAHQEVSEAITQLRPEIVSVAGLKAGIEYMLGDWERAVPSVQFEYELDAELKNIDQRKTGVLYRLVQEGITNAMRHGNPRWLHVEMKCNATTIQLKIKSKGAVEEQDNYALTILRERTSSLGGILQFECNQKTGESRLVITIPN